MEWTGARYADCPHVEVSTLVEAPPDRVWALVGDMAAMPSMSEELQSIEWVEPSTGPAAGVRFVGHNRHPQLGVWSVPARVTEYAPSQRLAWEVDSRDPGLPSAVWSFDLVADGGGTRLTQSARMGPGRSGLSIAIERMPDKEQKIVFVRMRELEASITATLAEIKRRVEAA